jgi:hypothetical protein
MPARAWLHIAALLAPLGAAAGWSALASPADPSLGLRQSAIFGGLGALAAQIAALLRWRALERRAREGSGAWKTGIGMAVLTHVLFGVLFVAAMAASMRFLEAGDPGNAKDLLVQAAFFIAASLFAVGALSLPLTALLAWKIAVLRRREIADDAR